MKSVVLSMMLAPLAIWASTDWMPGKVGVFAHYLPTKSTFNCVNDFDVPRLVKRLKELPAEYLLLTLGQNSGYFCAPNAAYELRAGYAAGSHCATRDIPAEIIAALKGTDIRFGLYLPCQPPNQDLNAALKFGLAVEGVEDGNDRRITDVCADRWSEVIGEWAQRYGAGVSLWWFDGAYSWCGFSDGVLAKYKAVCHAGNPDVAVAFNAGVRYEGDDLQSDYWAGEENEPLSVVPHSDRWHKSGVQWHVLTFMGIQWCWPDCRFRDAQLKDWIFQSTSRGGACTLEMKIDIRDGQLDRGQSEQFARVHPRAQQKSKEKGR